MNLEINSSQYPCTGINNIEYTGELALYGVTGLSLPISGTVKLTTELEDKPFVLREINTADYAFMYLDGDVLTLSNTERVMPVKTLEDYRAEALRRIDGKCSGAIISGVTVGDKHYSLSLVAQQNLKTAQDKIIAGAASVIFSADGEEPTLHTAAQITAIGDAAYEWGVVNTSYYAKLQKWIAQETDTSILSSIDYGAALPGALMQELATLLGSAGINLQDYSEMLG